MSRGFWWVMAVLLGCAVAQVARDGRLASLIPDEVKYKKGFVNPGGRPEGFNSAMLWGIAIADTRVSGYEQAQVEVGSARLSCHINEHEVVLNDDHGALRGGLYRRFPWFGTDEHTAMPVEYDPGDDAVILRVGEDTKHVWHFWGASPRVTFPPGKLEGCTVKMKVKISRGALLQVGFDYWRNATTGYGAGANNHEAGASDWYFSSDEWQEARFSDISRVTSGADLELPP